MNKDVLALYRLTGSVHTFSIRTKNEIGEIVDSVKKCVNSITKSRDGTTALTINPNKFRGDLFSYSEFCEVVTEIFEILCITEYRFIRVDFRLDSYDPDHYKTFAKLHRYLLSAIRCLFCYEWYSVE